MVADAPNRGTLRADAHIDIDGDRWRIVDIDQFGGRVIVSLGTVTRELSIADAVCGLVDLDLTARGVSSTHEEGFLASRLSPDAADRFRFRVAVVAFINGTATVDDVDGLLLCGNGSFDLDVWYEASVQDRIRHVRDCLSRRDRNGTLGSGQSVVGESTIHGWRKSERDGGLEALLPQGGGPSRDLSEGEVRFRDEVDELVRQVQDGPTKTQVALRLLAVEECRKAGFEVADLGSQRAQKAYVSKRMRSSVGTTAKQRQQRGLKPKPGSAGGSGAWAGQGIEIDQHVKDVLVRFAGSQLRYQMVMAVDSVSGMVLAMRMVPGAANAATAGLVIYDLLRNRPLVDPAEHDRIYVSVPDAVRHHLGAHVTWGIPASITIDRGSEFLNRHLLGVLARAGIKVKVCAPRQPAQKPVVESTFNAITAAARVLPGYIGHSPDNRGVALAFESPVPPSTFDAAFRAALCIHNDTPNRPSPAGGKTSPRQRFMHSIGARGTLDVLLQPQNLLEFLPRVDRVLTGEGLQVQNRRYQCATLHEWWASRGPKVPVHVDPRDVSSVWVPHPDDGRWLGVPDKERLRVGGYSAEFAAALDRDGDAPRTNQILTALDSVFVDAVMHPFNELETLLERDRVAEAAADHRQNGHLRIVGDPRPEPIRRDLSVPTDESGHMLLADAD